MTNLFFIIAPLQLIIIPELLEKNFSKDENIIFIFYKTEIDYQITNADCYFYNTNGYLNYFKSMFRFKKDISNIFMNKVRVFIPHPFHFATNYAAFNVGAEEFNLLPDGLLNYYERLINERDKKLMAAKKLLGVILGLTYSPYCGLLTGESVIKYTHFYDIKSVLKRKNNQAILPEFENLINQKVVLFLDQEIEHLVSKEEEECLRKAAIEYILLKKYNTVIYKRHPSSNKFTSFLKKSGINVIELKNNLPIELIINQLPVNEVVSFISSALLNLLYMRPEILATSIGVSVFDKSFEKNFNLSYIFKTHGVNIVEVKQ